MRAAIIYIVAVLGANLTATWFIHFPVFGQVAVGTFVFGFTFTQRDRMHVRGRKFVYGVIGLAALLSCGLSLLGHVPPRIILASVVAIILAETADTEVYQRLLGKSWWHRVLTSNAVSIPLDSLFFNLVAFAGVAGFPPRVLASIIFGEILVKFMVGAVAAIWRGRQVDGAALERSSAQQQPSA
ncbi:VUT family protein [Actomonas aquatica]|uniref:VUT family protein n=1 Tax=Actomonas aquatica TaxID=2866162 RepID=A0ABZ1CDP4_9BACT|nr:VUT family protein [Opitutus sp. WL0086]WRQ89804.1 VUT family protein [Opitutus sp. WL0086]